MKRNNKQKQNYMGESHFLSLLLGGEGESAFYWKSNKRDKNKLKRYKKRKKQISFIKTTKDSSVANDFLAPFIFNLFYSIAP